ncbi:uncharacterized protein BBOV_IV001560 [Babesia bovis T2Bo]|uniref:Uncharacterized protein n=1 Tax=Babesia bovis TaxID=5865 RepID=A7AVC7_BABBO|nr:uncharacterized protein BBOV_IV001560 [Babesia bovis T2Bo]EDO05753.1 hypothetical protein BBOV_IV001560 [Babesia bovis T2Bo]|eukprot:XP_001609321.1 hypothetical protein [Babesia bovis T2Bo]
MVVMDYDYDLREVCDVLEGEFSAHKSTCAIVHEGDDAKCVAYAVHLIGVVLNCTDMFDDKHILLLCKRTAWEAAMSANYINIDILTNCSHPCPYINNNLKKVEYRNTLLDCIISHAFGLDALVNCAPTSNDFEGAGSDNVGTNTSNLGSDMHTELCSSVGDYTGTTSSGTLEEHGRSMSQSRFRAFLQHIAESDQARELAIDGLIVRFVDNGPCKFFGNFAPVEFNRFVEPEMETKWNFIQGANEMCSHPDKIGMTVVAGLSHMNLNKKSKPPAPIKTKSKYNQYKKVKQEPEKPQRHPFDDTDNQSWEHVALKRAMLRGYALCITVTLNALDINLARSKSQPLSIPKFYLIESLPKEHSDHASFTRFLRSRFQHLYKLG